MTLAELSQVAVAAMCMGAIIWCGIAGRAGLAAIVAGLAIFNILTVLLT